MAIKSGTWKQYRDEELRIALGVYPKLTCKNVFGRNRNCADGAEEEIYSVENAATYPATALMTSISQTTDQVALRGETVEVVGVDINFDEVTQTAVLGNPTTTVVTLGTALLRVNSMRVLSATACDSTVRLHNAGESTDYAIVLVGENRSSQAHYTVPNNKTAFITNYWASLNESAVAAADIVDIQLYEVDNANSYVETLVQSFQIVALPASGIVHRHFIPYRKFGEHSDIIMTATAVSTVADVSAGFDIIIVND